MNSRSSQGTRDGDRVAVLVGDGLVLNVSLDGCVPPHHGAINLYEVEHGMLFNSAASSSF